MYRMSVGARAGIALATVAFLVLLAGVSVAAALAVSDDPTPRANATKPSAYKSSVPRDFAPGGPLDIASRFVIALRAQSCSALETLYVPGAASENCDETEPTSAVVVHAATLRALSTPHPDVPDSGTELTADVDLILSETAHLEPGSTSTRAVSVKLVYVDGRWAVSGFDLS